MQKIDRRVFLGGLAAAPLVYGLGPSAPGDPEWLVEALARMKDTGRWGVVLLAPAGEEPRRKLGLALYALTELDEEDVEAHDLFCQAVFLILSESQARIRFPKAAGAVDRILLDPDGNPLAWDAAGLEIYADSAKFAASFRTFIHGPDGGRLVDRARALEAALPEPLLRAVRDLESDSADLRLEAVLTLTRSIEKVTPVLAHVQQRGGTEEARRQARLLLRRYFSTLAREGIGTRLPYGSFLGRFVNSCGTYVPEARVSIACGMGRASKRTRKFISFLAQG